MRPTPSTYRCEVYLRTDTIGHFDAQRRVIERVQSLADRNAVDEAGLAATWEGVETCETDGCSEALETYGEFSEWARTNGFSLEPAFAVRPRYVPGTVETREAVVFPVVALAIYRDEELRAVVPSSDEFGHYTVHEALEGFERGDIDRWLHRFSGVSVNRASPRLGERVEL